MDDKAIVVPLTGEHLPPLSARRLVWYACSHREIGWEALVDEITKGAPPYPIIDELVCVCAETIGLKFPGLGPDQEIDFRFESATEPWTIDTVTRYVKIELQSKEDKRFYLDTMMRCKEKDLLHLMQCFLEFYDQIGAPGVVTAK